MAKKKVTQNEVGTKVLITPKSAPNPIAEDAVVKPITVEPTPKVDTKHFGKAYAVQIKDGKVVATGLSYGQATAKIASLEEHDKSIKGKYWKSGFYKIIED
jgi:hypothetical protein